MISENKALRLCVTWIGNYYVKDLFDKEFVQHTYFADNNQLFFIREVSFIGEFRYLMRVKHDDLKL